MGNLDDAVLAFDTLTLDLRGVAVREQLSAQMAATVRLRY